MATISPTMDRRQIPDRRVALRVRTRSALGAIDYIAMVLLIIGGLNWAMVGLFDVNVVADLFGVRSPGTRLIYILVGAAALYSIYLTGKVRRPRSS
ncbi:DUF378 domain-containing protein [Massilia horti]|uniref:DUF378 domain-containing protein n=1 Tax=Massilia horti TaxID=2562153 RepID=A0A4Y9T562_9BURK|nr:DUF378 domain-containing protein [Massilia horti]TFW33101.1 DUF378 domain-containing protein [Massilia horti]